MYKKALEIDETTFASRFHLGGMYHMNNDFLEALKCYTGVLKDRPNDKIIYIKRGKVYQDMGNHRFAIEDNFNKSIELEPTIEAYFYRGISRMKCRDYDKAIEDFMKAKDDFSSEEVEKYPGIYDGLGQCYLARTEFDRALDNFDTAITRDPTNIEFYINRA